MRDWLITLGLKKKPRDPNAPRYADLYERSVAAMLDLTLIYVLFDRLIFTPLNRVFYQHIDQSKLMEMHSAASTSEMLAAITDSGAAYWWLVNTLAQTTIIMLMLLAAWVYCGTTPGKWLLGLRIVRRDLSPNVSRWRYAVRVVMLLPASLLAGLGIFWLAFNKERRGWHDIVADTVVIHTRPEWWYWHQLKRGVLYVWRRVRQPSAPVK